jgi:serine/threonine protein kinase
MPKPTLESLERFATGRSSLDEAREVARWMEQNPAAIETLVQLADRDTWVQAIRSAASLQIDPAWNVESVIQKVQESSQGTEAIEETQPFTVPSQLDQFRILQVLGRGGMGMVCEAIDERLGRKVAIKLMRSELVHVEEHRKRFLHEARAVAAIEHDSIVPILSAGEVDGMSYLVMPLLRGETLASRLQRGALSLPALLKIAMELASGLNAAHAAGIIHRDIKPSNIWLERSADGAMRRARLLDFGLARTLTTNVPLTRTQQMMGTPGYMAPEQVRGGSVDARTDIFSLGCVLYEAFVGRRAFEGNNILDVLSKLATTSPEPIANIRPDCPKELGTLVDKMLAKESEQRPQSMQSVIESLDRIRKQSQASLDNTTPTILPQTAGRFGGSSKRRKLVAVGSMGFLFGLGLLGVVITIRKPDGSETKIETDGEVKITVKETGDVEVNVAESNSRRGSLSSDSVNDSVTNAPGWSERTSYLKLLEIGAGVRILLPNGVEQDAKRPEDFLDGSNIIHVVAAENPEFTDDFFDTYVVPLKSLQRLVVPQASRLLNYDRFFRGVGQMKKLHSLIATMPLDDRSCEHLSQCEQLAYLFWVSPQFTEKGAKHLLQLKRLREFQFGGGNATDSAIAPILNLPQLEAFTVSGLELSGELLSGESPLPTLKGISLSFCRFTNDPLPYLERFPNLQTLQMQRFNDPGKGLVHLSALQNLLDVNFQESSIRDIDGLRALGRAPRLQAVNFHACSNIGDEQIRAFAESRPNNLKFLEVSNTRVSDASIDSLLSLPRLQHLVVWGSNVTDEGFSKLANSTTLTELAIGSKELTVKTVRALAAREMPWESIWIGEGQLNDDAIEELSKFKGLRKLWLNQRQISPDGMTRLRTLLPNTDVGP